MKKILTVLALGLFLSAGVSNGAFAYSTEGAMYYNEGLDAYSRGEYSKALQSFKNAVAKDPDFIDALDDIRPIEQFVEDHPNFKMDVYMEICNQVDNYLQKKNN